VVLEEAREEIQRGLGAEMCISITQRSVLNIRWCCQPLSGSPIST
jgi:hypothetical protein